MEDVTFETVAVLARWHQRRLLDGDRLAETLNALCRSDRDRLDHQPGSRIVPSSLETQYVAGDEERIAIESAERYPYLIAGIGYALVEGEDDPVPSAWLIDERDGALIDVARRYRRVVCFYGVLLRATEVVNWTESHPHLVAERGVHRARLSVA